MTGQAYSLLLVSNIPVTQKEGDWHSIDLWVHDLKANVKAIGSIGLLAPEGESTGRVLSKLPQEVQVITRESVQSDAELRKLICEYDVVQVGAGRPAWKCRHDFRCVRIAKSEGKRTICGVSSDRALTTTMNASEKNVLKRVWAWFLAKSIYSATEKIVMQCDGVFLVGHGLAERYALGHPNVHVATASWISAENILNEAELQAKADTFSHGAALRLCVATRLERMKGVHQAIEALSILKERHGLEAQLSIYGKGPEEEALKELSRKLGVDKNVTFMGTVPYGDPFWEAIRSYGIMLLTNLNIEQPRLVFDALSQGTVPLCPDSAPYRALGLAEECLYVLGDPNSLADKIYACWDSQTIQKLILQSAETASRYTIESMHEARSEWIPTLLRR